MPTVQLVPTLRRRRLGEALRRYRREAGMSIDQAATAMQWDNSKVSRIENAKAHIRPAEASLLLGVYGVDAPDVLTAIEGLARDAGKKGWWATYGDVATEGYKDYLSQESDAESIRLCTPTVVPGLLQTGAYARQLIGAGSFWRDQEQVNALVEIRKARQSVLTTSRTGGRPPLTFWAVIHESVLYQRFVGNPLVMREQLRHLLDMSDLSNVTIQVMPMHVPPNPGTMGIFEVIRFPAPWPTVVLTENLMGGYFVEGTQDVAIFEGAFERSVATALPVEDSRELIKTTLEKDYL